MGHGGTLDPMASGVLVIGLGTGCKSLSSFLSGSKGYLATGRFGQHYDTLDSTGVVLKETEVIPERKDYEAVLKGQFTGEILQRPPAFSAVHVNGERAYDLARKQRDQPDTQADTDAAVDLHNLPARKVTIDRVEVTEWNPPEFKLGMECGGGTYVRSLIADSAVAAGSLAAMYDLVRTKQGPFTLQDCIQVGDCADLEALAARLK